MADSGYVTPREQCEALHADLLVLFEPMRWAGISDAQRRRFADRAVHLAVLHGVLVEPDAEVEAT